MPPTLDAPGAPAPTRGRRRLLAYGLRLAAGIGALAAGGVGLSACATLHPPLAVGSALAQAPALLDMYNATGPIARVRAVTPPSQLASGQPPVPAHLPDIVDVTQQNIWLGARGLGKQAAYLRPLDGVLPPSWPRAALDAHALAALTLGGSLWAVPVTQAHSEIALSVGLAAASGFRVPAAGLDLTSLGQTLAAASPRLPPGTAALELSGVGVPEWTAMAYGEGGTLTDGGRFTFASGASLQALTALGAICRAYGGINLFSLGRALLSFTFGNGNAAAYAQSTRSPLGLLPFLRLPRPVSPALTIGCGITRQCRDPEGAAAFLAWLAGPAAQRWLIAHGSPSARTDLAAATGWLPTLPTGDPTGPLLHPAPALVLPQVFWHPQIMQALGQATVAALSPGMGSTAALAFTTGQAAANGLLASLRLNAEPVL